MIKIVCVCGARPNFMKIAPLMHAFGRHGDFQTLLVHTGQHYDHKMSQLFFEELGIPRPDINLEVGSGSHAVQTAETMKRFEPVVLEFRPDYVLVVGDVNSTIACGLVAVKLGIQLIHVEAGLRSFDRTMPEEINRILTDSISDLLFVTEPSAVENLRREGVDQKRIHFVGNVMIDTLLANRDKAEQSPIRRQLGIEARPYGVVTLHRPSNVDDPAALEAILEAFVEIQKDIALVFPLHPRTRKNLEGTPAGRRMESLKNLIVVEPLGYLDFLCLMSHATVVITDSGGIQEETTILGVPCMTLRENTERPVTITDGTNRLVPLTTKDILQHFRAIQRDRQSISGKQPKLWDGNAAERIVSVLASHTLAPVSSER